MAPPKEGQANENIREFLADVLGLKKRNVSVDKGGKSKNKVIIIEGSGLNAEKVYEILLKHVGK